MSTKFLPRTQAPTDGVFLSVPAVYHSAPDGLRHALKMEVGSALVEQRGVGKDAELTFRTTVRTDRALLDFTAVDPDAVDLVRVQRDCELVAEAIRNHPDVILQAVQAVAGSVQDLEHIERATDELEKIGLTEQHTHANGGGLIGLLVVAGIALLCAGCYSCAHCTGTMPPPQTPHPLPADAGPG